MKHKIYSNTRNVVVSVSLAIVFVIGVLAIASIPTNQAQLIPLDSGFDYFANRLSWQEELVVKQKVEALQIQENNKQETTLATDVISDIDLVLDTPNYIINLPESWRGSFTFNYNDEFTYTGEAIGKPGTNGIGYATTVMGDDGAAIFSVTCYTHDWDPQGAFYNVELGTPYLNTDVLVVLSQAKTGISGELKEDKTAEYLQYVTLRSPGCGLGL